MRHLLTSLSESFRVCKVQADFFRPLAVDLPLEIQRASAEAPHINLFIRVVVVQAVAKHRKGAYVLLVRYLLESLAHIFARLTLGTCFCKRMLNNPISLVRSVYTTGGLWDELTFGCNSLSLSL